MALRPVSVTQLNEYIGRILQTDPLLGNISVTGEISNLKYHSSGHVYFSMVDDKSKVNCFLPASYAEHMRYQLGDGMEIIVRGYINVFKKGGTYTLFVRNIEISGEGNLAAAFMLLKEKLEKEGLFDPAHKKPLPTFPRKLGIITSETGAAVRDIIKIIKSRTHMTDILVFPVLVQGEGAAADIAGMIDLVNEQFGEELELLIVGRGGGSMEDLWAFNEEIVARAIFRSQIPIISAVGHEIDFTIADFVADCRAATPTAAAEMAVPDTEKLRERLDGYQEGLLLQLKNKLKYERLRTDGYKKDMEVRLRAMLQDSRHQIERLALLLEENKPERILQKGYGILEKENGGILSSIAEFQTGQWYKLTLADGTVSFRVADLKKSR